MVGERYATTVGGDDRPSSFSDATAGQERLHLADESLQRLDVVRGRLLRDDRPEAQVEGRRVFLPAGPADHDREMTLDGPRLVPKVVERIVATRLGRHRPAIEDRPHRADRFIEPGETLAGAGPELDPVCLVLELEPG